MIWHVVEAWIFLIYVIITELRFRILSRDIILLSDGIATLASKLTFRFFTGGENARDNQEYH